MRNQKLGNLGEDAFRTWCHQQNLTVHKSDGSEDRTGWDFMVEFPQQEYDRPRDEWPAAIECRVQVKSTDTQSKKKQIEVSNLERLVKAPIPTFFCFIEFDGHDTPQAAYLVHVGEELIAKTLKKIRKLESQKKHNSLNKHKMSVRYTDSDRFFELTRQLFTVGRDSFYYGIEKNIQCSFEELKKYCKVLRMFKTHSDSLIIEIKDKLDLSHEILLPVDPDFSEKVEDFPDLHTIITQVVTICHEFNIPENDLLVSINDIDDAIDCIQVVDNLFKLANQDITNLEQNPIRFELKKENLNFNEGEIQINQELEIVAFVAFYDFYLGSHRIGFYLVTLGCCVASSDISYTIDLYKHIIGQKLVTPKENFIDREAIDKELQSLAQEAEERGMLAITFLPNDSN